MIYNKQGNALANAYQVGGSYLQTAYDKDGDIVFQSGSIILKVMTYNVGQWYDGTHTIVPSAKDTDYYALQNRLIQQNNPDILVMEEYLSQFSDTGRSALAMLQQYFPYIHEENAVGSVSSGAGRCICSKYPITNYTTHHYLQAGSPRYYDACTITVNNIPITVVVTHLNYDANDITKRANQLAELITYLQGQTRFISCGDYNMLHCKATTDEDYVAMMQPILNAGFNAANCTDFGFLETYSDQPIGTYTGCLDNILTSSNIVIFDAYVDETKLEDQLTERTDHMPFIAKLQIDT